MAKGFPWFVPRRTKDRVAMLAWLIAFAMVCWPVLAWANRLEPHVLGYPFNFFWLWFWFNAIIAIEVIIAWKVWR
jgi:hypothetical protein